MNRTEEEAIRQQVSNWHNCQSDYIPFTKAELHPYVLAVANAIRTDPMSVRPWLTQRCTECNLLVAEMGPNNVSTQADHVIVDGYVIVACEWYWMVNPAAVGITDARGWDDWAGADYFDNPAHVQHWIETGSPR